MIRVSSNLGSQAGVTPQEMRLFGILILAMEHKESIAKLFIELKCHILSLLNLTSLMIHHFEIRFIKKHTWSISG